MGMSWNHRSLGSISMTLAARMVGPPQGIRFMTPIAVTQMSSSGVDFCMAIRGRYPGMTRIVMTNAPTREIVDARSHGVIDGYVVKPVSASTLLAQIRSSRKE